jgi:hypothetical protein
MFSSIPDSDYIDVLNYSTANDQGGFAFLHVIVKGWTIIFGKTKIDLIYYKFKYNLESLQCVGTKAQNKPCPKSHFLSGEESEERSKKKLTGKELLRSR